MNQYSADNYRKQIRKVIFAPRVLDDPRGQGDRKGRQSVSVLQNQPGSEIGVYQPWPIHDFLGPDG